MDDVLPIYFEKMLVFKQLSTQIQTHSCCFVKNFIERVIFEKFTQAEKYFKQGPLVPLVTNPMFEHTKTVKSAKNCK